MSRRKKATERIAQLLAETLPSPLPLEQLESGTIRQIPLAQIRPSPFQPRLTIEDKALEQLAASIRELGILEPLLVRPLDEGAYEIIAGERRWRAAQKAGLGEVPCIVLEIDDAQAQLIALAENIHREDLTEYERAQALHRLRETLGVSWAELARRVGLSRRTIMRLARFGSIPPDIEAQLKSAEAKVRHYEAVAMLSDRPNLQKQLAAAISERKLSGPDAYKVARALAEGKYRSVARAIAEIAQKPKTEAAKSKSREIDETVQAIAQAAIKVRGLSTLNLSPTLRKALATALRELQSEIATLLSELE